MQLARRTRISQDGKAEGPSARLQFYYNNIFPLPEIPLNFASLRRDVWPFKRVFCYQGLIYITKPDESMRGSFISRACSPNLRGWSTY